MKCPGKEQAAHTAVIDSHVVLMCERDKALFRSRLDRIHDDEPISAIHASGLSNWERETAGSLGSLLDRIHNGELTHQFHEGEGERFLGSDSYEVKTRRQT